MSGEAKWILWGVGLLTGAVALLLLVGTLAPAAPSPAAQQYFSTEYLARAKAYSRVRHLLFLAGQGLTVGFLTLVLARGWHHQAVRWLEGWVGPRPLLTATLVGMALLAALVVVRLPISALRFVVSHQYGLSNQSLALWVADLLRSTALTLALAAPLLAGLFWLIHRWPGGWWLPATAGFALYLVVSTFLAPVVIDPLFHRFWPLQEPALSQEVQDLAQRAGVPVDEVLVMDASRRTRTVNAYFTGLLGTRRIVLYDNLLARYEPRHVLLVVAHELGHWQRGHIARGIASGVLGSALVFWLAQRLLAGAGSRPGEPAQVALLLLFYVLISLASLPVQNGISRWFEREADRFALLLTNDGPGMVQMEAQLARDNLSDPVPHPLTVLTLYTHPPVLERMEAALQLHRNLTPAPPGEGP